MHSNKVGPTKGLTRYALLSTSGGVGTMETQSLDTLILKRRVGARRITYGALDLAVRLEV